VQKITIAFLKNRLSLFFPFRNIESAVISIQKTIAPKKYLYQSGYAIWCEGAHNVVLTLLDALNLTGEHLAVFTVSGTTNPMKLGVSLKKYIQKPSGISR
jgi:hypothetical protein